MSNTSHHLCANLKRLRIHARRTQAEVSAAMDLKRSSYSGYENGLAEPGIDILVRMARYWRMPVDALVSEQAPEPGTYAMGVFMRTHQTPSL